MLLYLEDFLIFLETDLCPELLEILMRLLKNLHESGIFLSVDQIDVGVHVVVFEGFKAVAFFLVVGALFFALFLVEVSFCVERVSLDLHGPLLVKFNEFLLMVQYLFEEFLSSCSTSVFLAAAHLLFESVESARFFFRLGEDFGASIKIAIY